MIRGIFAITLGVVLLFLPDKTLPMLGNFMGFFWLMSGFLSIRWGLSAGQGKFRLPVVAGVVGVLAGLTMLSRDLATRWVAQNTLFLVLGLVIFLTGLTHMIDGFQKGERKQGRSWSSFILGVFEVVLGGALAITPLEIDLTVYIAASVWALLGGFILIGDALRIRRLKEQKVRLATD
jgi:uncharacterized membrane protein HdeD (DUF308 family)